MTTTTRHSKAHFGVMLLAFGPDYSEKLVDSVLAYRRRASKGARNQLNRAIQDSVRVQGFRNASRAPLPRLKSELVATIPELDGNLIGPLITVWEEANGDLRDAATKFLGENGHLPNNDDDGEPLTGADLLWEADELEEAAKGLAKSSGHDDEHDAMLMLCLVSGKLPTVDDPTTGIESDILLDFLRMLKLMPGDEDEWEEIDPFVNAVRSIRDKKLEERTKLVEEGLREAFVAIYAEVEDELKYLDLYDEVRGWEKKTPEREWQFDALENPLNDLLFRLTDYSKVRPQANTRGEELERATERARLEDEVLKLAGDLRELLARERPPQEDSDAPPKDAQRTDGEKNGAASAQLLASVQAKADEMTAANSALQADVERLEGERDALSGERDSLRHDVASLSAELEESQRMAEVWRLAGVSARLEEAGAQVDAAAELRTVREAVDLAEKTFADRLSVALNSKSDKRSPYQRPKEVFDALGWLATVYHDRRTNPGGAPDFDKLIKESCPGWSYRPGQTEVTREQFEEWYVTTLDGKRYDLRHHIGKGNSYDPQNTIRIAFDWDDDLTRVVVGYIGMHQRNRKS